MSQVIDPVAAAAAELLRRRRVARVLNRFADDFISYTERRLRVPVWSRQGEAMEELVSSKRSAWRAGRKVSKTFTLVALKLWWAEARGGTVLETSATGAQIEKQLWHEMRRLILRRGIETVKAVPLKPFTGVQFPSGGMIVGRASDAPENMQGYSGSDTLYLGDEASGIGTEIVEALEGNLAGGGKMVLAGNPTQNSGSFFDAFHSKRHAFSRIHVSSLDSPNITGEMWIDGLAVQEWVDEIVAAYGEDSAFYEIHVLGNFASQGGDAVVPLSLIEGAADRHNLTEPVGRLQVGVDVAWTGEDSSVIQPIRGSYAYPAIEVNGQNPSQVAERVRSIAMRMRRRIQTAGAAEAFERPSVKVDVIGIGAGVYSELAKEDWLEVHPVNVASAATAQPDVGPGYANLRAQLAFAAREWLKSGALPPDEARDAELLAIKGRPNASGRTAITPKDALRKVLKRSTDRADALMLAIYEPIDSYTELTWGR